MDMLSVAAGKLASGEMYKTRFEEIEKTAGWNYNADGLGQDRALRPLVDIMQSGTWDWVHTLFQDGVLTTEVELLIEHCGSIGVTRIALQTFLRDLAWQFPLAQSGKAKQLHRIFDHHRQSATAATRVKASCAELLGVYGLVRHFVEHRLAPATDDDTKKCLESFKALCQAVDIILLAKKGLASVDVASDSLAVALARFSRLHRAAYGDDNIRPKHHWLLDIPPQLKRDSLVLDAFVVERTHLMGKGVADHCKNLSKFEESVLRGLVHTKLAQSKAATDVATLLGKVERVPGTADTVVADRMWVSQCSMAVGDVVVRSGSVGRIEACLCEAHTLLVVVEVLAVVARTGAHSLSVRPCGNNEVWPAAGLELVVAWAAKADGTSVVVAM